MPLRYNIDKYLDRNYTGAAIDEINRSGSTEALSSSGSEDEIRNAELENAKNLDYTTQLSLSQQPGITYFPETGRYADSKTGTLIYKNGQTIEMVHARQNELDKKAKKFPFYNRDFDKHVRKIDALDGEIEDIEEERNGKLTLMNRRNAVPAGLFGSRDPEMEKVAAEYDSKLAYKKREKNNLISLAGKSNYDLYRQSQELERNPIPSGGIMGALKDLGKYSGATGRMVYEGLTEGGEDIAWKKVKGKKSDVPYTPKTRTPEEYKKDGSIGFFEGATEDSAQSKLPFAGALFNLQSMREIQHAIQRQKEPGNYSLKMGGTEGEKQRKRDEALVKDYFMSLNEKANRGTSVGGDVGNVLSDMPTYIAEMALTGGAGGVIRTAGKREMLRDAARWVGDKAALTTKRMPFFSGYVAEGMASEETPQGAFDKQGNLLVENKAGKDFSSKFFRSLGDNWIELFSETVGGAFTPVTQKVLSKTPKLAAILSGFNDWAKSSGKLGKVKNFLKAGDFHGVLEEMGEERVGDLMRAVVNVDDFNADDPDSTISRIIAAVSDKKQALTELIAFALPGGSIRAAAKVPGLFKRMKKSPKGSPSADRFNGITGTEGENPDYASPPVNTEKQFEDMTPDEQRTYIKELKKQSRDSNEKEDIPDIEASTGGATSFIDEKNLMGEENKTEEKTQADYDNTQAAESGIYEIEEPEKSYSETLDEVKKEYGEKETQDGDIEKEKFKVETLPVESIKLDPERFQFKSNADKSDGVIGGEKLGGSFDPNTAGNILVWEDLRGERYVVNGHHRYELAKRKDSKYINAKIVKEKDGVSADEARKMGVLINIRDGQGDIKDYANFIRDSGLSEEDAEKEGILAREKGKTGFAIGKYATDNLWDYYKSGDITSTKAGVIADMAHGDEAIEAAGIKQSGNMGVEHLRQFLRLLKNSPKVKNETGDLFGFDDSAIKTAEILSKTAAKKIKQLDIAINAAKGAVKNPEAAAKSDVAVGEKARKKLENLMLERRDWENWHTNPEIYQALLEENGLDNQVTPEVKKETKAEIVSEAKTKNETGDRENNSTDNKDTDNLEAVEKAIQEKTGKKYRFRKAVSESKEQKISISLAMALGKELVFFKDKDKSDICDGLVLGDGKIYLNITAREPVLTILMHEYTHLLEKENPKEYEIFKNEILKLADSKKLEAYLAALNALYEKNGIQKLDEENVIREFIADFMGSNARDPKFWRTISKGKNFVIIEKLIEFLEKIKNLLFQNSRIEKDVKTVLGENIDQAKRIAGRFLNQARATAKATVQSEKTTAQENKYLTMPIDVVKKHADMEVALAKEALSQRGDKKTVTGVEEKPGVKKSAEALKNEDNPLGLDENANDLQLVAETEKERIKRETLDKKDEMRRVEKANEESKKGTPDLFDKQNKNPEVIKSAISNRDTKIEDFGEKIGGAKKDVYTKKWEDSNKKDVATSSLSEVFPIPDYDAMLESETSKKAVAFIHALRDNIKPKPKTGGWKLARYIDQVKTIKDTVGMILDGSMTNEHIEKLLQADEKTSSLTELYEKFGHEKSLKGYYFGLRHFSFWGGKAQKVDKWTITKDTSDIITEDTKEEMLEKFGKYLEITGGFTDEKKIKFNVYRKGKGIWIGKKVGSNYIDLVKAESAQEAFAYVKNNHNELVKKLEQAKYVPEVRRNKNEERTGVDRRGGKDITPEIFSKTFDFRGVEFGNWVNNKERQESLNRAYDALCDLADILDISTQAISLNGELGFAFGARGKGGKDSAAAHYEPEKVVINLTKENGAGSLAHEWWHALDSYFSRMKGKVDGYITENAEDIPWNDAIRTEMIEAFANVMKTIKANGMGDRARYLDARRTKPYWTQNIELSARTFEAYVLERMKDMGVNNDYLVNLSGEGLFVKDMLPYLLDEKLKAIDFYPYPIESEIAEIRKTFDKFFNTLEEKEENGKHVLFSVTGAKDSDKLFAVKSNPSKKMSLKEIAEDKSVRPHDIILSPDGKEYWGMVSKEIEKQTKGNIKALPIVLNKGKHNFINSGGFGIAHIFQDHANELKKLGWDTVEFLKNILNNVDSIIVANNDKTVFFKYGRPNSLMVLELRKEVNGYYSIVSAYPTLKRKSEIKGKEVWHSRTARSTNKDKQLVPPAQPLSGVQGLQPPLDKHTGQTSESIIEQKEEDVNSSNDKKTRSWLTENDVNDKAKFSLQNREAFILDKNEELKNMSELSTEEIQRIAKQINIPLKERAASLGKDKIIENIRKKSSDTLFSLSRNEFAPFIINRDTLTATAEIMRTMGEKRFTLENELVRLYGEGIRPYVATIHAFMLRREKANLRKFAVGKFPAREEFAGFIEDLKKDVNRRESSERTKYENLKKKFDSTLVDIAQKQKMLEDYARTKLPRMERDKAFTGLRNLAKRKTSQGRERYLAEAKKFIDGVYDKWETRMLRMELKHSIILEKAALKKAAQKGKKSDKEYEYNKKIEEYINRFTSVGDDNLEALRKIVSDYYERYPDAKPEDLPGMLKNANKQQIARMNRSELRRALADIEALKSTGKTLHELEEISRKAAINRDGTEASGIIAHTVPADNTAKLTGLKPDRKGMFRYGLELGKKFHYSLLNAETIVEGLCDFKDYELMKERVFNPIARAEEAEMVNIAQTAKKLKEIFRDIDYEKARKEVFKKYSSIETVDNLGRKITTDMEFTYADTLFIYANSKNENNYRHLAATFGSHLNMIDEMVHDLPEQYKKAVDELFKFYDEYQHPRINEVFKREHGVDMPKEKFYFPILSLDIETDNPVLEELKSRFSVKPGMKKGFTTERSKSEKGFKKMDFMGNVLRNIRDVEHYIAFSQAVRDINAFLKNESVQKAITAKSETAYKELKNWLASCATGKLVQNTHWVDFVSDFARTNFVTAVLGGNITTVLQQPVALSMAMPYLNKLETLKAVKDIMSNPLKLNNFINERSVLLRYRSDSVMRELAEMAEKNWKDSVLDSKSLYQKFKDFSMLGIQYSDKVTCNIIWLSKYREMMNQGLMSEAKAIEAANEVIRKTQQQGGVVHLPSMFRGGGTARLLTLFMTQYNKSYQLLWKTAKNLKKQGITTSAEEIFFNLILPGVLTEIITNGFTPPSPKDDPEAWILALISPVSGGLPVIDRTIEWTVTGAGNKIREETGLKKKKYSWQMLQYQVAPLSAINNLGRAVAKLDAKEILYSTGVLVGVPGINQARKTIKGWNAAIESGDMRYIVFGKYAIDRGNEKKKK